jgi:hypothetical protein
MKIVKFKDGKYGIRRGWHWWIGYEYKDLTSGYWWHAGGSEVQKSCKSPDLDLVQKILTEMTDMGTPIDKPEKPKELWNTAISEDVFKI